MPFDRRSGILLHPTSLPGQYGIGTLGQEAFNWIDFLAASGQRLWQVMPLAQRVMVIALISALVLLRGILI